VTTFEDADMAMGTPDGEVLAHGGAEALFDLAVGPTPAAALVTAGNSHQSAGPSRVSAAQQAPLLTSAQWRAETFQLVNWGGFQGQHVFTFAPGATLISGASGTGKSTLLDAYIALMMPSDTPFNGASNDAVAGRARSADQRNLISYLRGKIDTTTDEGREVDKVLRGEKAASWGAVGMTFVSDDGQRFTALRVYYLPPRATRTGELTMRMATYDDALDLSLLEALVPVGDTRDKFAPRMLKDAFPGMRTYDTYNTFAQALHTRLGIGANGDGEKALRLLVRIQAGHQIKTVDDLYKEMVLERPATYAAADRAIEHFDALEGAYREMVTEQSKADLLAPITERQSVIDRCRQSIRRLDLLGVNANHAHTPVGLWRLRTKARILDDAVDANQQARTSTEGLLTGAQADEKRAREDLVRAENQHREAGGTAVERLEETIAAKEEERDACRDRRTKLAAEISVLNAPLDTPDDHAALLTEASTFLSGYEGLVRKVREQFIELGGERHPLMARKKDLNDEKHSLSGRHGRVDKNLDDMRRTLAEAARIDVADLPFVAELIDVPPGESRWRVAIETVLHSAARTLLVPLEELERFSTAIDSVQLRGRITFEGAERAPHQDVVYDRRYIAGKLTYKDSPYSQWVAEFLRARGRNALCVETAAELGGGNETRVTPAGQTRRGRSGAHGRLGGASIIGFSNEDAIADINAELADLDHQLDAIDVRLREVEADQTSLGGKHAAYQAARRYSWGEIDDAGAETDLARLKDELEQLLAGNDRLKQLTRLIAEYRADLDKNLIPARVRLEDKVRDLNSEHEELIALQNVNNDELGTREGAGDVLLTAEDAYFLDAELAEASPGNPYRLADFDDNTGRLQRRLRESQNTARTDRGKAEADLAYVFGQYQERWPDPNLGSTAPSYPEYATILDKIIETGLHERRARWRRQLTNWSGEDLVPLNHALDTAVEDIEDRLVPINDILATLPFGASRDRLRIKLRKLTRDNVVQFRRDLRRLAGTATKDLPDDQTEQRFHELQTFMARIRRRDDPQLHSDLRDLWDRDNLLDVRKHVEITAERYDDTGALLSTHSSLGGKSGGESQELVAFIVGAALRFRLGDELRDRPRFAPVFLDEGFVKADSEFAGRAVQAWKGLGFQLIVGAPLDKVSALEKHMDEMLGVVKNLETNLSYVNRLRDPDKPGSGQAGDDG
jgi:uncharacterized protein YPO0396